MWPREKGREIIIWSSCSALDVAISVDMVMTDSQNSKNLEEPFCWVGGTAPAAPSSLMGIGLSPLHTTSSYAWLHRQHGTGLQGWDSSLLALGIYSMTAKGDLVNKTAGAEGRIHLTKHRHLLQHEMNCALLSGTD